MIRFCLLFKVLGVSSFCLPDLMSILIADDDTSIVVALKLLLNGEDLESEA